MMKISYVAGILAVGLLTLAQSKSAQKTGNSMEPTGGGLLLVVSQGNNTVSIIEPGSGRSLAVIRTRGVRAHEVAVSPDGRFAYLPIYGNSGVGKPGTDGRTIEILDIKKREVTGSIDLGRSARPHCAKFGPDGLLYISAEVANAVDVIDPKQGKRVASVPTDQPESHMIAITRDGKRAYTSNVGPGTVSVLDLIARKVVKVIAVAKIDQRISLSADDRWVFTADQEKPRLAVIDTATNELSRWIDLPGIGYGTAVTPDGRWLLVALPSAAQVAVVDLAGMKVSRTIPVPSAPQEILVRPDHALAYVSCNVEGKVAALDLNKWDVVKLIDAAPGADGLGWAER
jgi:DNA-binding beta-propeller fold protein YncE